MKPIALRTLLKDGGDDLMRETAQSWLERADGNGDGKPPSRSALLASLCAAMEDEARVLQRVQQLPRKLQDLFEPFLAAPGNALATAELFQAQAQNFKSRFDLEACLAALQREGLVFPARDKRWSDFDGAGWAVPAELAACVQGYRQRTRSALRDVITLQGFLDARYFRAREEAAARGDGAAKGARNGKAAGRGTDHARKIYKLYTMASAIAGRRAKLPPVVAKVLEASMLKHGGLSTWSELVQELDDDKPPDLELCRKCLEESMLGTAGSLPLARFGIQPIDESLVVFHEVVLEELRRHAAAHPVEVQDTLSCGGNLASNVGRFLRELQSSKVLFTADGDLFKASQKRIGALLLPVPGGFMPPEAQLDLVYRFCLFRRLIDRRGERALRPTATGQEFDRAPLSDQLKLLLGHFVEDRALPGEAFHQVRLRRVLLRLLRRAEPLVWQELAYLPFLARNAYLAQLDGAQAEEFFAARFRGGGYTPTETLQQMCWNLLLWVKRRLFPLGIVDLGLRDGRPIALRLSQLGADLLDAEPAGKVGGTRSTVLVNPDFEVLLFPGDDVHEAVHAFDRFARRLKSDHVHQFKLEPETVRAGLQEGLALDDIVRELTDRARAPVPQNVLYVLEEWAQVR
ncbi:MAG: helicase-associated domain-containing protein [Planctomycetota bacterium]